MLVEFTRFGGGGKIAVNPIAVAWVGLVFASGGEVHMTAIAISGKEADVLTVNEPYDDVVEALRNALED